MNEKFLNIGLALILACLLAACSNSSTSANAPATTDSAAASSSTQAPRTDQQAIEAAIRQHLQDNKGINMSAMEMTVSNVKINGDQAQADTEFRLKQGGTSMLITYFLERHADGWLVVRNQPNSSGQFAHPPMDKVHSGAATGATGAPGATSPNLPDVTDFLNRKAAEKSSSSKAPPQR